MEKEDMKHNFHHQRERLGLGIGGGDGFRLNSNSTTSTSKRSPETRLVNTSSSATAASAEMAVAKSDFVVQWGNLKRPRCMKIQNKDDSSPGQKMSVRDSLSRPSINNSAKSTDFGGGFFNLRQRPSSPPVPPPQRTLRNSEIMRGDQGKVQYKNGSSKHSSSSKRKGNDGHVAASGGGGGGGSGGSSEMGGHDGKKGGSSSGSDAMPAVWPPKFVIALTNKEKEEDFMAIKGSKLPQRPKKRAKLIQRTVSLVSPGAWLSDLTLERYEVREKKKSKKKGRGLKAMGKMDDESD